MNDFIELLNDLTVRSLSYGNDNSYAIITRHRNDEQTWRVVYAIPAIGIPSLHVDTDADGAAAWAMHLQPDAVAWSVYREE